MSTHSSQGFTIGVAQEASLGAGGTYYEIRVNNRPDFPTNTRQQIANPNVGHAHPASKEDDPVAIGATGELSFDYRVRRYYSTGTTSPWLAKFFESMGCNVRTTTATTVGSYVSTIAWDLVGEVGTTYGQCGDIILPHLDAAGQPEDNLYYPTLLASSEAAGDSVVPLMALPAATSNDEAIEIMTTIYPLSQPTQSGKSLAFEVHTRGDVTGDGSNDASFLYKGCALSSIGTIKLEPQMPISIPLTFSLGNIVRQTDEMAAESFVDSEQFAVVNDYFRVEHAAASASGGITRADVTFKSAEIDLGITAVPVVGFGDGSVNGRVNYILVFGTPKVTINAIYHGEASHPQYWTNWETPGTRHMIGLVQPTDALARPAWAWYAPNCYLDPDTPPKLDFSKETVDVSATFICSTANFTTESPANGLWNDPGFAPWYMGISGETA